VAKRDDLLNAVAAIYDAALQPEAWPAALSRVGGLVNSTWLVMSAIRLTGEPELIVQDENGDPNLLALFNHKYNTPETNPAIPLLMGSRPGTILLREEDMKDEDWHKCGLYKDIYRPSGVYYGLGALVLKTVAHIVPLGVNRPKKCGAFARREIDLLRHLIPHFERAVQTYLRLADLQSHRSVHEALWDSLAVGVILLDGEGKVLWENRAATAVLAVSDGLSVRKGRLSAMSSRENARLQCLIRAAVASGQGRGVMPGGALSVPRASLARPLSLLISPFRMDRTFVRNPAAVVLFTDPERKLETRPELLQHLYGLTAREAAVAALLLQDIDLREAAQQLRVSVHTARSHLRVIFEKTDTHRQAELVHLLLRGVAGLH
jgi:DNA-binding CsgD family transcriptional regulator/PAS domain-containing protein